MKLLISVRSVEEALLAARNGADLIDLKEPGAGALGALPLATIREIVAALRVEGIALPISATIGDWPMDQCAAILDRVAAVAACGVDMVKVGIEAQPRPADAHELLTALAACCHAVAPVFIADRGIDLELVDHAAALGFAAAMLDTADKHVGSLFDTASIHALAAVVQRLRARGVSVGLAGALRTTHASLLAKLSPDFAGFRTAVCARDRTGTLEQQRLRSLRQALALPDLYTVG
jgi:(5-formylfuran-3-yl)methyl phosphate synthase